MIRQGGILFSSLFYFTQLYETVTEDGLTKNLHYLYAPTGLFAIFATFDNAETMTYTITDHQGSLAAYTGNAKEPVTRLSYDAWGRRRNAADGSYDNVSVAEPVEAAFAVPEKVRSFVL